MNILITGANGFLGSHLVKYFLQSEQNIYALVRKNANLTRLNELDEINNNYNLIFWQGEKLDIVKQYNIDIVIHTATNYGRNQESFLEIAKANELFPLSLLENLPNSKKLIFINTHSSLPSLASSYAIAKENFVNWGKYLSSINKIKFINLKLEHFYGPGDDKSKFIEYVIDSLLNNVDELNLTKGEQKRDFIYVNDVVRAYQVIINNLDNLANDFLEIDIGTGSTISIHDLVIKIKQLTNNDVTKLNFGALAYRINELMESRADISLLSKLGWQPNYNINDGIEAYIKGYYC